MNQNICFKMVSAGIMYELFEDEIVVINLEQGTYYNFDKVGVDIWQLIEKNCSQGQIVEIITRKYNINSVQAEKDIPNFISKLKEENLIEQNPEITNNSPVDFKDNSLLKDSGQKEYITPVLHKYTDMQDLLLLDPIHEIRETGWPDKK